MSKKRARVRPCTLTIASGLASLTGARVGAAATGVAGSGLGSSTAGALPDRMALLMTERHRQQPRGDIHDRNHALICHPGRSDDPQDAHHLIIQHVWSRDDADVVQDPVAGFLAKSELSLQGISRVLGHTA